MSYALDVLAFWVVIGLVILLVVKLCDGKKEDWQKARPGEY